MTKTEELIQKIKQELESIGYSDKILAPINYPLLETFECSKAFLNAFKTQIESKSVKPNFFLENEKTVVLYWELEDKTYLRISFDNSHSCSVFKRTGNGVETYDPCFWFRNMNGAWFNNLFKLTK